MKKMMILMLASVFVVGSLALMGCDDDDDNGSSYDNVAACQAAEDAINDLECVETDFDYMCSAYESYTQCNWAPYFDCLAEVYECDEDGFLTTDMDKLEECMGPVYDDLVASCT